MIRQYLQVSLLVIGLLSVVALVFTGSGCESTPPVAPGSSSGASAAPATQPAGPTTVNGKTGQQIWAETCSRCHNVRSPSEFNSGQWDVIVMHMRQRANLTGPEARAVAEFLKSSSQ